MCGIVGLQSNKPVNQELYDALIALQHRGQDSAGIATMDEQRLFLRKANGLVRDVFYTRHMQRLVGNIGIGHVRYPTAGTSSAAEAQPMYVNSPYGITLAHNGNLTNAEQLKADLFREDLRHVNTHSDSEILLNVFAHELLAQGAIKPTAKNLFAAVEGVHRRCQGGYAAVAIIVGCGIVAFRDCFGIRPLVFGKRVNQQQDGEKYEYMVASESAALDILGFDLVRDVKPGEAIFIDVSGALHTAETNHPTQLSPCIFEQVYLARPDSTLDGISVYKSRLRMGEKLADRILERYPDGPHDIDVVIPIPDTSRTAALPLAHRLGVKFREGFVKNRYIGRTFIMPGQQERKRSVRQKFNAIDLEFRDKNVLLVDDSIVRGTTIRQIIEMAREAGARKVYLASAAPPVRYPNVYGIDLSSPEEFLANGRNENEICQELGADWLMYQTIEDLIASAREGNINITHFDCSVFDGKYVTGDIDATYLESLSLHRNDTKKQDSEVEFNGDQTVIELHNHA